MAGEVKWGPKEDRVSAMAEVMGDPVRAKILFAVAEVSLGGEDEDAPSSGVTVREISAKIDEPQRRVRYHLSRLLDGGFVVVTDQRTRRGVVERYYSATEVPVVTLAATLGEAVSVKQQRQLTLEILKAVFADVRLALESGTYNSRPEWVAARSPGEVDEQGWGELSAIQEAAIADTQDVLGRAKERIEAADEQPFPVTVAHLMFETPGWPDRSGN